MARVAAPNRRIVGWIAFRRVLDEAELLRVAVDPDARRRGVARALLEHGLAVVGEHGARECHLEVAAENAAALALYRAFGFREVGRRKGYYGVGRDALLLTVGLLIAPEGGAILVNTR